tara:strand:+ start:3923 stop:4978 length:1056 start_codon:yes stop_codon:yes gene_type:complete
MLNRSEIEYLKNNPDVSQSSKWSKLPYQHYLRYGKKEGRKWNIKFNHIYKESFLKLKNGREEFVNNKPFPHIVIDNFLKEESLQKVVDNLPSRLDMAEKKLDGIYGHRLKYVFMPKQTNKVIQEIINELSSKDMLEALEDLTNIKDLIGKQDNPGNGIHFIGRGGSLGVHTDHNMYNSTVDKKWYDRRLNILLYLNDDWKEKYGGHIELWDEIEKKCIKKVLPVMNRLVIFATDSKSYHGHPEPLNCPENKMRKSIALYYYTKNKFKGKHDFEGLKFHTTFYLKEGSIDGGGAYITEKDEHVPNYVISDNNLYNKYHKNKKMIVKKNTEKKKKPEGYQVRRVTTENFLSWN